MAKTIFEKHSPGRKGYTLSTNDVEISLNKCIPEKFQRKEEVKLPEVRFLSSWFLYNEI